MKGNVVPPTSGDRLPITLFKNGFRELVSVVPPNAPLSPRSKLAVASLGKAPGIKYKTGLWGGFAWQIHDTTLENVKQWVQDGANIGLRAEHWPCVDIDVLDQTTANIIEPIVLASLGPAPVRIGLPPKRLLMYRLEGEPFGRIGMKLLRGRQDYLVEVLGAGRQYLVHGTHPSGNRYSWSCDLATLQPDQLTPISRAKVEQMFATLAEQLEALGWECVIHGEQNKAQRTMVVQDTLKAPSLEALREAVALIPNPKETDRDGYIRMGFAIKAAAQADEFEGLDIFLDWGSRWEGGTNDPETVRRDWRGLVGPYSIGWSWVEQLAKRDGYVGGDEFEVLSPAEDERSSDDGSFEPSTESEKALAREVFREHGHRIRYMASAKKWVVWDGRRWKDDVTKEAEEHVGLTLDRLAHELLHCGGSEAEKRAVKMRAELLGSAHKREAVLRFVKTDQRIALTPEQLDADPLLLNTPVGMVDLRTLTVLPHDPLRLCSKTTGVGPDFEADCPVFKRFLSEATGGDQELEDYLQRVAGYALTGLTQEQVFFFFWGPGGNGKSVFLNALSGAVADYGKRAPMDTFTAAKGERHTTDLAGLKGSRLVIASEVQAGRRWDEARLKDMTGGDRVSARFMRGDFFTYVPQFKIIFAGNHKPDIRDIDAAIRRRVQLIPFTVTPALADPLLSQKLESEYPAILAWAIRGCMEWQRLGLAAPNAVRGATQEYFSEQDVFARWIEERCEPDGKARTKASDLFQDYREWANTNGEYVGSQRRLGTALKRMGFRSSKSNVFFWDGIRIRSVFEVS